MKKSKVNKPLYYAFQEALLAPPVGEGAHAAVAIPNQENDYVSVGAGEQPVILLSSPSSLSLQRPPINLQHISVEFGIRYRVHTPSRILDGDFVVISLRGNDSALVEPFCTAVTAMLASLPGTRSPADVERMIREFVELMMALSLPSPRSVAGLWAELWLIATSFDPQIAVSVWHHNVTDRFDFALQKYVVEVKATESEERNHEFSYEQLRRSELPIKIASLRVRRIQNGTSISDLVDKILEKLNPQMRMKLVRNVFGTVGAAISEASEMRFDEKFAATNLRVIAAENVPAPVIQEGSPISAVRFRVNLNDSSLTSHLVKPIDSSTLLYQENI